MQQTQAASGSCGAERKRVEAVVETLATLRSEGESLAEVAHDARNMVTALGLYCDLLEEPGVLSGPFLHYGSELRLVAAASRRLVEKLAVINTHGSPGASSPHAALRERGSSPPRDADGRTILRSRTGLAGEWDSMPSLPIDNLAVELAANRNLLAALSGPSISVDVEIEGGARPVWLTGEDLTRVLVNLVKNAAEAMPGGGSIQIALRERPSGPEGAKSLALTIEDNGAGIPPESLDKIFASGYTTRSKGSSNRGGWTAAHRGLGLAIARSIVEGAGGWIQASNRNPSGARFEIELPERKASR
jgi:signal transduction histidine kinase